MNDVIREKLEQMRESYESKTYEELLRLGWVKQEPIMICGKKNWPAVWSELMTDGAILLVVQLTRWHLLRIWGSTDCIGFLYSKNGQIEYVDENYLMNEVGHP